MSDDGEDAAAGAAGDDAGSGSVFERLTVGQTDVSDARTITEADVVNFAGVSGDFNHIHVDEERMQESMFGGRIAHGMLVFSIATGLVWQNRTDEERDAVVAFYGVDDLRFRGPVYPGDTVHVEMEVTEKRRREDGPGTGTVRYHCDVKKQDGSTVISCEMLSLLD